MDQIEDKNNIQSELLKQFNNRDSASFGKMYTSLYKQLYYLCNRIYFGTDVHSHDVIQDVFFKVWDNKKLFFESVSHLKSYLYSSIYNNFKMYLKHKKVIERNEQYVSYYNMDQIEIFSAEAEIFSCVPTALNMLPVDCAESFRLFIDGYSAKEIAHVLNKPLTTIYSQRDKAVKILKNKIPKHTLYLINILFS